MRWLTENAADLALTAVSVAELRHGVHRLPDGARRDALSVAIDELVAGAGGRILAFDTRAAEIAGRLRADREAAGRAVSVEDTMIAAICLASGHSLATRNARDFADTAVPLLDPWQ